MPNHVLPKFTETPSFVMDERRYPLILVRFRGTMSDATADLHLTRSTRCVEDGWVWALIVEASYMHELGANQRRKFSSWIQTHRRALTQQCVCQAYVVPSIIQRMALRSILMISPMPVPNRVFNSVDAAADWCAQRLLARDLSPGPRPQDWGGAMPLP